MANKYAPPGQVFVCLACGKRSKDLYGEEKVDRWWDTSCVLNAALCYEDKLVLGGVDGCVIRVEDGGVVEAQENKGEDPAP